MMIESNEHLAFIWGGIEQRLNNIQNDNDDGTYMPSGSTLMHFVFLILFINYSSYSFHLHQFESIVSSFETFISTEWWCWWAIFISSLVFKWFNNNHQQWFDSIVRWLNITILYISYQTLAYTIHSILNAYTGECAIYNIRHTKVIACHSLP